MRYLIGTTRNNKNRREYIMMCPKCGKEMEKGWLFSSKDGAFSFANEVPGALEKAAHFDGEIPPF